jgi:hypothetical protein
LGNKKELKYHVEIKEIFISHGTILMISKKKKITVKNIAQL